MTSRRRNGCVDPMAMVWSASPAIRRCLRHTQRTSFHVEVPCSRQTPVGTFVGLGRVFLCMINCGSANLFALSTHAMESERPSQSCGGGGYVLGATSSSLQVTLRSRFSIICASFATNWANPNDAFLPRPARLLPFVSHEGRVKRSHQATFAPPRPMSKASSGLLFFPRVLNTTLSILRPPTHPSTQAPKHPSSLPCLSSVPPSPPTHPPQ